MRPFKIAKKTKIYISLALVLLCNPAIATTADLSQITRLANQGDVIAQTSLAERYYDGEGVPQNYKKAVEWYEKAANQGEAIAQMSLGFMYAYGRGIRHNDKKSVEWFTKAANQEYIDAQHLLGIIYKEGDGAPQDYKKAKEWYGKACDNGRQDSCDAYKDLNQRGF